MADETTVVNDASENTPDALATLAKDSAQMATWSDEKKKDYVTLFKKRANASMYILRNSAHTLAARAKEKQFLGTPRYNKLVEECQGFVGDDRVRERSGYYDKDYDQGAAWKETYDRSKADMDSMVSERVASFLKNLPSINAAMLILDPDTHEKMLKRDELRKEGQALAEEFEELSVDIRISDLPEDMTIGEFKKNMKELKAKRKLKLERLDEIGKEGQELERHINKALFKGLPGIGDEIEAVVKDLYQQAKDMGTTGRDVENTVLYGDCDAAFKILDSFKNDERKITTAIGLRFQNSLELLKLKVAKKGSKKKAPEQLNE